MSEKSAIPMVSTLESKPCCGDDCCGGAKSATTTATVAEPSPPRSPLPRARRWHPARTRAASCARSTRRSPRAAAAAAAAAGAEANDEAALAPWVTRAEQRAAIPEGADLGLRMWQPDRARGASSPARPCSDLGSGGGIDCFLAAREVGATGRVIGVGHDARDARARACQPPPRSNATNVEFRLGEIEHLPVADASVDAIISNCVVNLSPDKPPGVPRRAARPEARRPARGQRPGPDARTGRRTQAPRGSLRRLCRGCIAEEAPTCSSCVTPDSETSRSSRNRAMPWACENLAPAQSRARGVLGRDQCEGARLQALTDDPERSTLPGRPLLSTAPLTTLQLAAG